MNKTVSLQESSLRHRELFQVTCSVVIFLTPPDNSLIHTSHKQDSFPWYFLAVPPKCAFSVCRKNNSGVPSETLGHQQPSSHFSPFSCSHHKRPTKSFITAQGALKLSFLKKKKHFIYDIFLRILRKKSDF